MFTIPALRPVTMPELLTVAVLAALLFQMPPDMLEESVTDEPEHTDADPEILPALGAGATGKL
jgi:hypothetical protein